MLKWRMRKKHLLTGCAVLLVAGLTVAILGRAFPSGLPQTPRLCGDSVSLKFASACALSQSYNNCAAYSAMAAIQITRQKMFNPEDLAQEFTWRTAKGLTYPFGLLDLLHKHQVKTQESQLSNYSNEAKLACLREQLSDGRPLIILGKVHGVRQYLVLVGYSAGTFHVYDPLTPQANQVNRLAVDYNQAAVGNKSLPDVECCNFGRVAPALSSSAIGELPVPEREPVARLLSRKEIGWI